MGVARLIGAVIAVGLLVAACGGETPSDAAAPDLRVRGPATLADLVGPWQRQPFSIDPNVRAAADRACRADGDFPSSVELVAVDARGDGRLISVYAGPRGSAECAYGKVDPTGTVTGGLSRGLLLEQPPEPGKFAPSGGGGWSDEDGAAVQYVTGRVGAGTARVVLDVEGIGPVAASLDNGWYIAWWPVGMGPSDGQGPPRMLSKAFSIMAYDASGQVTDRIELAR